MKTDIEELIKKNRDDLDIETPPAGVWEGIRTEYQQMHAADTRAFSWWKVAAVVFLTSSVGLFVYSLSLKDRVNELASLGDFSEEYREMEQNYQQEIMTISREISLDEVMTLDDLAWMVEELRALEQVNEQYRRDIGTDADPDLVVAALIDYYEKKIRLLKKLELEINRNENEKRITNISAS